MFNWLSNWMASRQRNIFHFFDGKKWRKADPHVVWVALLEDPDLELDIDIPAADRGDRDSTRKMVNAVHRAFKTKPLGPDGDGLTVAECWTLLGRFIVYCDMLKKNSEAMQMSMLTSDGTDCQEDSRTSDGSESTSTPSESEPDEVTES